MLGLWIIWLVAVLATPWLALRFLFEGYLLPVVWVVPIAVASAILAPGLVSDRGYISKGAAFALWLMLTVMGCVLSLASAYAVCATMHGR
jgi:hypothetical protein